MLMASVRCFTVLASALLLAACGGSGGGGSTPDPQQLAAALPDGNHVLFVSGPVTVGEDQRTARISIARSGDGAGNTTVGYRFVDGSAEQGRDYTHADGTLSWAAGETGIKHLDVLIESDLAVENTEQFSIELVDLAGVETLSGAGSINLSITDAPCVGEIVANVTADTVLDAACYHMTTPVSVTGAQLTVSAGTTIIADAGTGIAVEAGASISSVGAAAEPVVFKGSVAQAGHWSGIVIRSASALQQLSHSQIRHATVGVDVLDGASLAMFGNNVISDTTSTAVKLPMAQIDILKNNRYENTAGGIELLPEQINSSETITMEPLGTHFVISDSVIVNGSLELGAGVELRMGRDARFLVTSVGQMAASGTADQPVSIRGVQALKGYWNGVQFVSSGSSGNVMTHTTIAHGGGDPARAGNIVMEGPGTQLVLENCALNHSEGFGLVQKAAVAELVITDTSYSENTLGDVSQPN